jgi:predicted nucleic acid-binding Zn ribbon protein
MDKRKKEVTPLKEAFEELLRAYKLNDKFNQKLLIQSWPELMGNTVASRTTSLFIKDKTLFVKLTSGPVKKELMMNKSKVMTIIEDKFGKDVISDIAFL